MKCLLVYKNSCLKSRGQTIVLAAMMVLFLAFVVFSTLGIAWKTKERIRLQVASDSSAYSQAVKTARAFNYFAYTNRSIASHLVSMTVAHAYQTEISTAIGLYINLAIAWVMMLPQEACHGWKCLNFAKTIKHEYQDIETIFDLAGDAGDFNDDIRGLDTKFIAVIDGYRKSLNLIRASQRLIKMWDLMGEEVAGVASELGVNSGGVIENLDDKMLPYNAPAGSMNELGALWNIKNLKSAFAPSDDDAAKIDMTDVANAARPLWVRNRALLGNTAMFAPLMARIAQRTKGVCVITQTPAMGGIAGIYPSRPGGGFFDFLQGLGLIKAPEAGVAGRGIYSLDTWTVPYCQCRHWCARWIPGSQPFPMGKLTPSEIYSGSSWDHAPGKLNNSVGSVKYIASLISRLLGGNAHGSGTHVLDMNKALSFERFNIKEDGNYRQPAVYKGISQDLSVNEKGNPQPWDIFDAGKFEGHIFGKETHEASVQLSTSNEANSISKALVYYHHPGHWQEPPNFWNPFWRAKLHPWARTEFAELAAVNGGDFEGAVMQQAFSEHETAVMNGGIFQQ